MSFEFSEKSQAFIKSATSTQSTEANNKGALSHTPYKREAAERAIFQRV